MGHRIESSTTLATGSTPGDVVWTARPDQPAAHAWCRCGILNCPDVDAHDFAYRGSETTWREASIRPFPSTTRRPDFSARAAA